MLSAWEGADRLMGGTGDLSERIAQELSEPVTQRVLQPNEHGAILGSADHTEHAALSFWLEGDLTTTNVITAIMQASPLHMVLPSRCRAGCSAHWEALQLA